MTKAWCITDGSAGMHNQTIGLANAMGLETEKKTIIIKNPWNILPSGWYPTPSLAIQNRCEFQPDQCPKYVISCGKRSVYASLYLKSQMGNRVTTIHLQDPNINSSYFDYVVAPFYDAISGPNVIDSTYTINHITKDLLEKNIIENQHRFNHIEKPLILVTLGGKNRHFNFEIDAITDMSNVITDLTSDLNAHCIILFSRRTPEHIKEYCRKRFNQSKTITVWQDQSINPYLTLLGLAEHIVLTCDSTSMISEAIATQKPTYVYQLPLKKKHSRIQHFIDNLVKKHIIGKLQNPLPYCKPIIVNETYEIGQRLLMLTQQHKINR